MSARAPEVRLTRTRRLLDAPPVKHVPGQLAVEVEPPLVEDAPPRVCQHGNPRCGAVPVRPYPCGLRCEEHQPARTRPYFRAA
uniref:aromatic ring-opening dioxygenase LigA n=1 Tax=Streptomyces polyasparticus TaxID=2767826 RepID=UPI00280C2152|nr:aromatic ring-opening dioxygenase LigA [Streptomyces polyasparticus]